MIPVRLSNSCCCVNSSMPTAMVAMANNGSLMRAEPPMPSSCSHSATCFGVSAPRMRSALRLVHFWWPLAVGWSVTLVVHRATLRAWSPSGLAVLLLGICAAYSLDRLLDAPSGTLAAWMRRVLAVTTSISVAAMGALLPMLPRETAVLVPVVGAVALLYPAIKRLPLAKTVFVPLVWTWCAIALPFNDGSWFGWHWILQPIAAPLFLLFAADALLCDLKDEECDRRSGVASLPVILGPRRATGIAVALALAAGLCAYAEQRLGLALSALGLGLVTLRPALLATDVVGPLVVDVILTLPGLLIAVRMV